MSSPRTTVSGAGTLHCLPNELVFDIISHLPQATLLRLQCVSRIFYHFTTPRIYRMVYYVAQFDLDMPGVTGCGSCCGLPNENPRTSERWHESAVGFSQGTTIYHLPLFLRTMIGSARLRSYPVAACFCFKWSVTFGDLRNTFYGILDLVLPSLRFLHATVPVYDPLVDASYPFTSLCLTEEAVGHDFQSDEDMFYSLFSMPTLRRLNLPIDTVVCKHSNPLRISPKVFNSNVNSLAIITDQNLFTDVLGGIWSWPKALRSIEYSIINYIGDRTLQCRPRSLFDSLRCHLDSLVAMAVHDHSRYAWNDTSMGSLRDFTLVKWLGVPTGFLLPSTDDSNREQVATGLAVNVLSELPPALEVLRIQAQSKANYEQSSESLDLELQRIDLGVVEFCRCLAEIAGHKASRYPKLKAILIWQIADLCDVEMPFHSRDEFLEVAQKMKNTGITLHCTRFRRPPPFLAQNELFEEWEKHAFMDEEA